MINVSKQNTGVREVEGKEKKPCWSFSICSFEFIIYPSISTMCPRQMMIVDSFIWASLHSRGIRQ